MANTTFTGPVRSENGFKSVSKDAATGTITDQSTYANNASVGGTLSVTGAFTATGGVVGGVDATSAYVQINSATATAIADSSDAINTANKVAGTLVLDTTNSRIVVALGANATSDWAVADGSATVTPS